MFYSSICFQLRFLNVGMVQSYTVDIPIKKRKNVPANCYLTTKIDIYTVDSKIYLFAIISFNYLINYLKLVSFWCIVHGTKRLKNYILMVVFIWFTLKLLYTTYIFLFKSWKCFYKKKNLFQVWRHRWARPYNYSMGNNPTIRKNHENNKVFTYLGISYQSTNNYLDFQVYVDYKL